MAQTSPFILQAILYQAVVQTFQHTGPQASLDISVQAPDASTWRIRFDGFSVKEFETFPDARTERMAESIGVAIHWDRATDRLEIDVPVSAEALASLRRHRRPDLARIRENRIESKRFVGILERSTQRIGVAHVGEGISFFGVV